MLLLSESPSIWSIYYIAFLAACPESLWEELGGGGEVVREEKIRREETSVYELLMASHTNVEGSRYK